MRKIGKEGFLISIESDPRAFLCLKKNIGHLENTYVVGKAAWKSKGVLEMSLGDGWDSSVVSPSGKVKTSVQADTLDNIIHKFKIGKVDFLKMDIEGAELEALEGSKYVLDITKHIVIETHIRKKKKTTCEVRHLLEQKGFKIYIESHGDACDMVYGIKGLEKGAK